MNSANGEISHSNPFFLPDGKHFFYVARDKSTALGAVYVGSLDGTTRVRIMDGFLNVSYVSSGHLLYVRGNTLVAEKFDKAKFAFSGEPVSLVERVTFNPDNRRAGFSVSDNGVLAYRTGNVLISGGATGPTELVWYDRSGKILGKVGEVSQYAQINLSPNGRWASVERSDPLQRRADLWLIDLQRDVSSRVTFDSALEQQHAWSPDSMRLAYTRRNDPEPQSVFLKPINGNAAELARGADPIFVSDWSPDGTFLLVRVKTPTECIVPNANNRSAGQCKR